MLQAQPTRWSALQCTTHLTPHLFPSPDSPRSSAILPSLHQSLLRLLYDDDEEIRRGASTIVTRGICAGRTVVNAKAVEMWWNWFEGHLSGSVKAPEWIEWLWELSVDAEGFGESYSSSLEALCNGLQNPILLESVDPIIAYPNYCSSSNRQTFSETRSTTRNMLR